MKKIVFIFSAIVLLSSCELKQTEKNDVVEVALEDQFVADIEQAHNKKNYSSKEIIQFEINLVMRGKVRFKGMIQMTPDGGKVRMTDSTKVMIWDGQEVYISPSDVEYKKARFDLLTWSYFFAAPYKLSDPGTNHNYLGDRKLAGLDYTATKLTFEENIGDSPDDWYVVYKDTSSNLLAGLAYIVTATKSVEEAESDPHALTYEAYSKVDGIPFATQWNLWTWNEAGELSKLLGSGSISNIQFIANNEDLFKKPI